MVDNVRRNSLPSAPLPSTPPAETTGQSPPPASGGSTTYGLAGLSHLASRAQSGLSSVGQGVGRRLAQVPQMTQGIAGKAVETLGHAAGLVSSAATSRLQGLTSTQADAGPLAHGLPTFEKIQPPDKVIQRQLDEVFVHYLDEHFRPTGQLKSTAQTVEMVSIMAQEEFGKEPKPDAAQCLERLHYLLKEMSFATFAAKAALPGATDQMLTHFHQAVQGDPRASPACEQALKMMLTEVNKHPDSAMKRAALKQLERTAHEKLESAAHKKAQAALAEEIERQIEKEGYRPDGIHTRRRDGQLA